MSCEHKSFMCECMVNRLEDIGRFQLDVKVVCEDCKTAFKFLGLPLGLDLNSASVSFDGETASLAIAPKGEAAPPISGVEGYSIKKVNIADDLPSA
jgi:hypothetical protein